MSSKPGTISIHRALDLITKKSVTTLSEFIWKLKNQKPNTNYQGVVIERAQPCSAATNRCNLCIAEKYFILKTKSNLNKRKEIFSSCPHRKKHLLQNYQRTGPVDQCLKKNNNKATEHSSVIPEERSGEQATPLSSA